MKECRVGQEENGETTSVGSRGGRREDVLWVTKRKERGHTSVFLVHELCSSMS